MSVAPGPSPSSPPAAPGFWRSLRSLLGIGSPGDWVFKQICQTSAALVIVVVLLIVTLLALQAGPAVKEFGLGFFTSTDWIPTPLTEEKEGELFEVRDYTTFGGLTFIYGSVMTSLIAMILAVPLGVGTAAYLAEIAPGWMRRVGSFLVELLAAIPSVVYGFWGITFLAPLMQKAFAAVGGPADSTGKGILAAGILLAIMIVPYVTAVSYDVCRAVPTAQRQGSLALGATRWQTISRVVLPYARPGIIGGCFLALGRAIGETLAVTMIIGNELGIEPLPFGKGYTIPSIIAMALPSSQSKMQDSALIYLALVLLGVTILMNVLARLLIWQVGRPRRGRSLLAALTPGRILGLFLTCFLVITLRENGLSYPAVGAWLLGLAGVVAAWVIVSRQLEPFLNRSAGLINNLLTGVLALCLVATCVPLFLILGYITYRGIGAIDLNFFTQLPRPLGEEGGGLANALVGSGLLVGLATLFAVPLGLLASIFLAEYSRSRLAPVVRFFGELLTGVPSIVIGTFVYALIDLIIHWNKVVVPGEPARYRWLEPQNQFSGWAGAFALGVMMIPVVMRAAEEALKLVPRALRDGSHALGAHHWQTVLRVSVPAALPAIITGIFLAVARIAGETAPLLMTAFGNDRFNHPVNPDVPVLDVLPSPSDKTAFLPLYIYQYSTSGNAVFEQKAWAAAVVLLAFIMVLNVGVRLLTGKRVVLASRAE
jgi:phosphate transport system permease protein